MADVQAVRSYRVDTVGAAAIVVTVDAVLLLAIAVVGVPFLMFVFADENGTWPRLWPLAVSWLVAFVLAVVCGAATARLLGFGDYSIRRVGVAASLGTAVAAAVLTASTAASSPGWLLLGLPLTVANLAAALVFAGPDRATAVADRFPLFRPAQPLPTAAPDAPAASVAPDAQTSLYEHDASAYARPEPAPADEPTFTRDTIDLLAFYGPPGAVKKLPRPSAPRRRAAQIPPRARLHGRAAFRTHAGIRLPRRAHNRPSR
jgi:hypothetical protein